MNGWAKERLAPTVVAIVMMLLATPSLACDRTTGCPAGSTNTDSLPANMLPTYAQAKPQAAAAPVNLRKFTKKQTRSARRASSRKAHASKAHASKVHISKARASKASRSKAAKIAPELANANAELTETDAATAPADVAETPTPAAVTEPATTHDGDATATAQQTDVVSAEDFNDVDRTAWENPEPPRLMQFTALDSHAEMRADDSKWNHTSTVGKIFVALGALLTIGSAIRMLVV